MAPEVVVVVLAVVFLGGAVKGLAGFGYALAGTAVLAAVLPPSTAVVLMILPTLGANLYLLGELDRGDARQCLARFWPYVAAAAVGTALGMVALRAVPRSAVALGLGLFVLAYVALAQPWVAVPGVDALADRCFRPGDAAKAVLGLVSGLVFGATNVAVQVVAYLDSLGLDRSTFVGVLAMIMVGVSTLRVGLAAWLGLYDLGAAGPLGLGAAGAVALSAGAVLPGLAGVRAGAAVRPHAPEGVQTALVLGLLAVVGVRLTLAGLGLA